MSDQPDPPLSADEVFALVGNEIRAQIIRILNEKRGTEGPPPEVSFSELFDALTVDIPSSQFNYHLQKLVGQFVEQTEGGYRIRPSGMILYRTLQSGTFRRVASIEPIELDVNCYVCENPVRATYEGGEFTIQCPGCEHLYLTSTRVPAGAIEDERELLARIDQFDRHKTFAFNRGVCPSCAAGVTVDFVPAARAPFPASPGRDVYVHRSCDNCGNIDYVSVGKAVLHHPLVWQFHYDHGIELQTIPQWELEFVVTDHYTHVQSEEPWEVSLTIRGGEETLALTIDEAVSVVEWCRG